MGGGVKWTNKNKQMKNEGVQTFSPVLHLMDYRKSDIRPDHFEKFSYYLETALNVAV